MPASFSAARVDSTDVKITASTGPVDVQVARGDINISPAAAAEGAWKLRTGAGDVEMALLPGFALTARTGRGETYSDYSDVRSQSVGNNAEMQGRVAGGSGKNLSIDVAAGRGNIRVNKQGVVELERTEQ